MKTAERAEAGLATLTGAVKAAFPSAQRNLMVSVNNSTVPAPSDLSRPIPFGIQADVILTMLCRAIIAAHKIIGL